jgi:hypothetical protein
LPKFEAVHKKIEAVHKKNIDYSLAQLLLQRFIEWNIMYVYRHEGSLASADKDPPSDFVTDILNRINEEKSLEDHAREVSGALSWAFWDVACTAWPFILNSLIIQLKPVVVACARPPPLLSLLHSDPRRSRKLFDLW